jgi:tetratricopeptide (TPR) repeat protein
MHTPPYEADRKLLEQVDKLQDMVEKLQKSSKTNPQLQHSYTEAPLMQCTSEVIVKGTTIYEANLVTESVVRDQGTTNQKFPVLEWISTLESIRRDQQRAEPSAMVSEAASFFSEDETHNVVTAATSAQSAVLDLDADDLERDDFEDDLETDLAKSALDTGTKAFEAQEWEEADNLLQEGLHILQQLPRQQREFCDIFCLHYNLAVCAYHLQEPKIAEEALTSLIRQSPSSDEHRRYIYEAAHQLSQLYIHMGQIERARAQCEKALQGRRRILGKGSDASFESTALMAHIHVLLNNRARATSYLAMIPEARREAFQRSIEGSLGTNLEHFDSSSLRTRSISEGSDLAANLIQSRLSTTSLTLPVENHSYTAASAMNSKSPAANLRQSHQCIPPTEARLKDRLSVTASLASADNISGWGATEKEKVNEEYSAKAEALNSAATKEREAPEAIKTFKAEAWSRKELLDKIGCQPKDRIEEAVCEGNHSVFANLLKSKRDSWRSKLRKRVSSSERVTALHFAALFGEIDMARGLLGSGFNINEVPFGYSTRLTPLKLAIGARQVDMVEFLIANGAKPVEPDSWSTLAGQLMNYSWLMKTMSEAEKDCVPNRMIAILSILLKHGWDINVPFETSGKTVLHQAVSFWTGSYRWDLNLRAAITSFLCERGANYFQVNAEGKTPYDMALASDHQDLLLILDRSSKRKQDDTPIEPFELSN